MRMLLAAIETPLDHNKFLASRSKKELLSFVIAINKSCTARRRLHDDDHHRHDPLVDVLKKIKDRVASKACSATTGAVIDRGHRERFGNKSFRDLHAWLPSLVASLGIESEAEAEEVGGYLQASFGDAQRLDYGTGHETAFVLFLYCLFRIRAVPESRLGDCSLVTVLREYFECCRAIQTTYNLEPAGSRGVWALDDYQCLSFLFGSAQHCGGNSAESFGDKRDDLLSASLEYAGKSQSPILASLKGKTWRQINTQILLYYETQVLGKFVVARHILFGTIFKATWK